MAKKDPAKVARKWAARLGSATQDYTDAINNVDASPMEAAARKKDTLRARFNEAVDNGTWEAGLRRVSLDEWKQTTTKKGAQRLAQGATTAEGKVADFQAQFLDHVERVKTEIRAMPNVTAEDRKARMLRNFDLMKQFKGRRR